MRKVPVCVQGLHPASLGTRENVWEAMLSINPLAPQLTQFLSTAVTDPGWQTGPPGKSQSFSAVITPIHVNTSFWENSNSLGQWLCIFFFTLIFDLYLFLFNSSQFRHLIPTIIKTILAVSQVGSYKWSICCQVPTWMKVTEKAG